jgi:hypothetical protein
MAKLTVIMYRDEEKDDFFEGSLERLELSMDIGDPDEVTNWLNAFSAIQRAAGFAYEGVGVHSKLSDGEQVEHWSDF